MKTVVGMFSDVGEAQRTFDDLVGLGYGPNDISVVTSAVEKPTASRMKLFDVDAPDAGKVAACGPIATVLARHREGLSETLQNVGVSPSLAEHYVDAVKHGETLESLVVDDRDADRVVEVMKRHAARYRPGETQKAEKVATEKPEAERIEGLKAEKPETELFEGYKVPSVEKKVEGLKAEKPETERVEGYKAEKPETERVEGYKAEKPESERLDTDKIIDERMRSTNVEIEQLAGEHKAYLVHFESLGVQGSFDEALGAYDYGRGLRRSNTERWEDIEEDARTRWEAKRPGTWEGFKDAIRYAWSRARLP